MSNKTFENLSELTKDEIISKYQKGEAVWNIRKVHSLTYEEIRLTLNERNIEIRPNGKLNRAFSDQEEFEVIDEYKSGKSIRFLAKKYDVSKDAISGLLRRGEVEKQSVNFFNIKKQIDKVFEVDFNKLHADFNKKFPKHAEVELVTEFITNISELYNACDIGFTMTNAECWHLPSHESISAGKLTIAPRYGGQLDFMNDSNSLLISGKKIPAPKTMQYWSSSPYAAMFEPDVNDAAKILQHAVKDYDELLRKFTPEMIKTRNEQCA